MDQQTDNKKPKFSKQSFRAFLEVFEYVSIQRFNFLAGIFFLIASSLTFLTFPYLLGLMLNVAEGGDIGFIQNWLPEGTAVTIGSVAIILVIVLLFQGLFSFGRIYTFALVSEKIMASIRTSLYDKLITLSVGFFEQNRVGDLTSRITADVTQLQDALSWSIGELFRQVATLIIGITIIMLISPQLTLLMLATFPLVVIVAVFFGRFVRKLSRKTQDALAQANVVAEETLQNIGVVKSFTGEHYESGRYSTSILDVVGYALKTAKYRGLFVTFFIVTIFGGIILVIWRGAVLISLGEMEVGFLTSFVLYTMYIGASVGGIGDVYTRILKAMGATERIREILRMDSEVNLTDNRTTQKLSGQIVYKELQFAYPTRPDIEVLKGLSFEVAEGEKVALVGSSGAGKSTIVQLLMRLYDVSAGEISIDGINITEMDLTSLRSNIGIVPQEVMLFGGTIKENILYGRPSATEDEVMEAAQKANAWEFITQFPEGLETLVGERGIKLSGGQRQRIAIARAVLKNPSILILDEATSSLDSESEHLVQQALDELMKGRTSIIIAHRLSTIRDADRILVIQEGKIAESGRHEELAANEDGFYRHLLQLQLSHTPTTQDIL